MNHFETGDKVIFKGEEHIFCRYFFDDPSHALCRLVGNNPWGYYEDEILDDAIPVRLVSPIKQIYCGGE